MMAHPSPFAQAGLVQEIGHVTGREQYIELIVQMYRQIYRRASANV
jgi:hypothetical protein